VPPPFPTTSPLAVAATRILAAYLSRHKLSPAEAASLGGTIADALASLARGASVKSNTAPAPAEDLLPRRQAKPRTPRQARAVVAEAEVPIMSELPVPMPAPIVESEPEPEPTQAPEPAVETEVAGAAEMPRKRKRPSRPRSRRGKAAALPEDPMIAAPPEIKVASEPMVAEEPGPGPKPRRMASRARRVVTA
jgi:hypothetical protein